MGIRGELFTTEITLDNRTYFFNVKENRTGDIFLQVVESKNIVDGNGFDRHAIVVFEEDMQKFLQGFERSLNFIEKAHKNKSKDVQGTGIQKKKFVRRKKTDDTVPAKPGKTPKRVKVISKKELHNS